MPEIDKSSTIPKKRRKVSHFYVVALNKPLTIQRSPGDRRLKLSHSQKEQFALTFVSFFQPLQGEIPEEMQLRRKKNREAARKCRLKKKEIKEILNEVRSLLNNSE